MRRRHALVAALLFAASGAAAHAAEEAHAHWTVTTTNAKAQELFDRGLAMLYAFNVGEARVAFEAAAQHDPELAMAYWGAAAADTLDINLPSTPEGEVRGAAAVARARSRLAHAGAEERALIGAMAARYGKGTLHQRYARFADAMERFARGRRDEPNALVIAAIARFVALDAHGGGIDLQAPRSREMVAELDRALEIDPTNLGAHHLRIHLLEYGGRAQDALADAEALSSYGYPPGESHLPHMAGHVWARVGEYERLAADNVRAVDNDRAYFALGDGPGQRYLRRYHDHDLHFVLYALTTVGRADDARALVRNESAAVRAQLALRLHDDATVLAEAPADAHFARAFAAARSGRVQEHAGGANVGEYRAAVRAKLVAAAAALHGGDVRARVAAYAHAYDATKGDFPGDPKDDWPTPIGEGYGAALLAASRAADAERVFAAELRRFPNDPHLEWGLAEAQRAQGNDDAAARAAYRTHWKGARDLTLADLG